MAVHRTGRGGRALRSRRGAVNASYLASGADYAGFADTAHFAWVTDAWRAVVAPNVVPWISLLVVFEATVGALILSGGRRTQLGYVGVKGGPVVVAAVGHDDDWVATAAQRAVEAGDEGGEHGAARSPQLQAGVALEHAAVCERLGIEDAQGVIVVVTSEKRRRARGSYAGEQVRVALAQRRQRASYVDGEDPRARGTAARRPSLNPTRVPPVLTAASTASTLPRVWLTSSAAMDWRCAAGLAGLLYWSVHRSCGSALRFLPPWPAG